MMRYLVSAVLLAACNANSIPKLVAPGSSSGASSGGATAGSTGSTGDTTPPTGAITPASGASIPDQQILTLSFSESITRSSLVLGGDLGSTNPTVAWQTNRVTDDTATLTGTWPQGAGKTLTVDYKDLAGNAGATISTTYTVTDAPSVLSVTPANAGVLNASAHIKLVFSRAMDTTSAKLGGVLAGAAAPGAWSTGTLANDTLTIAPASAWVDSGGVQRALTVDASGVSGLAAPTEDLSYAIDTSVPAVSNAVPADTATIGGGQAIVITFSEPVKLPGTLTNSGTLGAIGTAVLSSNGTVLTITPATTWNGGAGETLILPVTITNLPGTPIVATTLHYTVDVTAPTLTLSPLTNGQVIDWDQAILITLSEPIDTSNLAGDVSGSLLNGNTPIVSAPALQLSISPAALTNWATDSGQTLNITVQDLVGNTSATLALTFDVLDNAVYVDQAAASTGNTGTRSHPYQTIAGGIAQSQAVYPTPTASTNIRVAVGAYTASGSPAFSVPINTLLVGGWANASGTWTGPSATSVTSLTSTETTADPAITVALNKGSGLQYFQVNSSTGATDSVAVEIDASANAPIVTVNNNFITAGAKTLAQGINIAAGSVTVNNNSIAGGLGTTTRAVTIASTGTVVLSRNAITGGAGSGNTSAVGIDISSGTVQIDDNLVSGGCDPAVACTSAAITANDASAKIYNNTLHEGFGTQGSCVSLGATGLTVENNLCVFSDNQAGEHIAFLETVTGTPASFAANAVFELSDANNTTPPSEYGQFGGAGTACTVSTNDACYPLNDIADLNNPFFVTASNLSTADPVFVPDVGNWLTFSSKGAVTNSWVPTAAGLEAAGNNETAATVIVPITADYAGTARPGTPTAWSIGAYQY